MANNEEGKIEARLAGLWQSQLSLLQKRLDLLDHAAAEASSGTLSEALRTEAVSIAHKLSGSLGMFGYQQGTDTAREIEQILNAPTPHTLDRLNALATRLREILQPKL
jgi:HPt (histidine-containing phosphotransfer) domain-containing protein